MSVKHATDKYGGISIARAPTCYLCRSAGSRLYENKVDRLFNTPGLWDFRKCSNSDCGLIWMDPMPAAEDTGKLYLDYYTHYDDQGTDVSRLRKAMRSVRDCYLANHFGYEGLVHRWFRTIGWLLYLLPVSRARINFDVMCLPALEGGRLLEIGSGSGAFLSRMQRLGWNVCGVDPDPAAVSSGQCRGLDLRCGTLEQMRFPSESFHVIIMNHVIEHVHDPVKLLKECHRVLLPDGRLVLTTPNTNSWGHKIFAGHWRGLEPPRHLMLFSLQNLQECTNRSDFHTVALRSISRWGRNIFVMSKATREQKQRHRLARAWMWLQGYSFQILESLAEQFSVWLGEEIYFVGQKSHAQRYDR
jgi:2-polyprenyl-3-methyl-5-hydroxy-6-metoxy-1,4-benzoquinol methylase